APRTAPCRVGIRRSLRRTTIRARFVPPTATRRRAEHQERTPMKGLILAAGLGTRLRPITSLKPKPTIAVANRPLIHHAVDNLVDAGVREIGVVVSYLTV